MSSKKIEPSPRDRKYVRSIETGDRGYLVRCSEDTEKLYVRLDRPSQTIDILYNNSARRQWVEDGDHRPLTATHIARICHAADQALAECVGDYGRRGSSWHDIAKDHKALIAWTDRPPKSDASRETLWRGIQAAMKPLTADYTPPDPPMELSDAEDDSSR